jgi:hypothetical protein
LPVWNKRLYADAAIIGLEACLALLDEARQTGAIIKGVVIIADYADSLLQADCAISHSRA